VNRDYAVGKYADLGQAKQAANQLAQSHTQDTYVVWKPTDSHGFVSKTPYLLFYDFMLTGDEQQAAVHKAPAATSINSSPLSEEETQAILNALEPLILDNTADDKQKALWERLVAL